MRYFARLILVAFLLLFAGLILSACSSSQPSATATSTASVTLFRATETIPPTPTHSPTPKPTVKAGLAPTPNLKPTIDPTILPSRLMSELKLISEPGINGHSVQRIAGWAYGFTYPAGFYGSWFNYPSTWLDDDHLLLLPVTGEGWGQGLYQATKPVVLNLKTGASWLPPTDMWSSSLQNLVASKDKQIVLYDLEGNATKSFAVDGFRSYLAPSGQRLFVVSKSGGLWLDLKTGQQVPVGNKRSWNSFSWSPDETRLFDDDLCLTDASVGKITCMNFELSMLGGEGLSTIYWVPGDKVMLDWPSFFEGTPSPDNPGIVLLIDPMNRSYQDVRTLAGFDKRTACSIAWDTPFPADRNHVWLLCDQKPYLIDLRTFNKQVVPTDLEFVSWSPDSKFALTQQLDQNCCKKPYRYAVYSLTTTEVYSVTSGAIFSPTWSTTGSQLAYLAEDRQQLGILDAATQDTVQVALPQPVINLYWHPQNHGLVAQADDNSLWWIADPSANRIEQLTAPLPEVRDVKWSPSGDRLAFVSGSDVYVVKVSK